MQKGGRAERGRLFAIRERLFHVSGDEFRHLEHGYFALTAEEWLQLVISQDIALVRRILEVMLLDVLPDLLDDCTAGHRTLANDCFQLSVELERLQECRIRFSYHTFK